MANRIFSTGQLFVTVPVVAGATVAAAVKSNAASGTAGPLNWTDAGLAADGAQYDGLTPATGPATVVIWDLGASVMLSGVTAWYTGANYQFDCSNDGTTWFSSDSVTAASGTEQALTPTGRYIRFQGANLVETRVFVGGVLVAGPPVAIEIATLQNITFTATATTKELWAPVQVSAYAIARVYYNLRLDLKATGAAFSAAGMAALVGFINSTGTGPQAGQTISTLDKTVTLPSMTAVFNTVDISGVPISLSATNVSAPNVSLPFKIDDFLMPSFEASCYPDPTSKTVAVITIGS